MEIHKLKQKLQSSSPHSPVFIFTGEEVAIMDIYIQEVAVKTRTQISRVDSVAQALKTAANKSVIGQPKCFIIRDDKEYAQQEKVWENLNMGRLQGNNSVVILIYSNLDKRGKFYKAHADKIVEFNHLLPEVLVKYVQKVVALRDEDALRLIDCAGADYGRLMLELDKLRTLVILDYTELSLGDPKLCGMVFKEALADGVFTISPKDQVFEMVTSFTRKDGRNVMRFQYDFEQLNATPLGFMSLLYNQLRTMLLIKGAGTGDVAEKTGLDAWRIMKIKEQGVLGAWTVPQLVEALRVIRWTEKGIKTGEIEAAVALDFLITQLI